MWCDAANFHVHAVFVGYRRLETGLVWQQPVYWRLKGVDRNLQDNDRCGILPFVFDDDFGFERYAEFAMDVPMYFVYR